MRYTHFVGFNGEEYHSAVKAFAAFHTPRMGLGSAAKISDGDLIIFASAPHDQEPRRQSFDDIIE